MPKKSPPLEIAEITGDRYPDLKAAQNAALPIMAGGLAAVLRGLLASGMLEQKNGRIILPANFAKGERKDGK